MSWNKTDRSFKTLINKRVTDSDAKFYFNEKGDFTINTHQLEIWVDAIPSTAPGATTDIVEYYNTLTLVEDTSVPSKQTWFATSNSSTVPAQTDETSRLKNWVSDKYGSTYEVVLYDTSNVQIPPSDGCGWFFDYQTGILTFTSTTTTTGGGGSLSSRAPFKIKGYRYIGRTGLDGNIIKSEVRVATTPATSFSGWSYSSELIDTGVTSATLSIDGISLNTTEGLTGDRILIKNWSTLANNGIYYVERAGDGVSDTWRFRRAPDFNDTQDIFPGTMVFVRSGTVNARTVWSMSNASFTTLDAGGATGEITFAQFITATTRWSALTAPDANLSLGMSTYTTTFNWATGTSTNNLFSLTTDASANGTGALLNLATGSSSTVLPLLVKAGATTALTVNASAQVLIGTLSSGRVTYAGASGLLQDSANMTFDGNRLSLATTGSSGGLLIGGDAQIYRDSADVLRTPDSMRVDTSVGINIAAPATTDGRLFVSGSHTSLSSNNYNISSSITHTVNTPDTTTGRVWGLFFNVNANGSGTFSDTFGPTGIEGYVTYSGSGTSQGATGIITYASNTGSGTLVRSTGIVVLSAVNSGGGHITNLRSVDVNWSLVTSASNQTRIGLRIGAGPTPNGGHTGTILAGIQFNSDSGTAVDGIVWGTTGDTNLYRSASNTLKTDDSLVVGTNLSILNAGTFSLYESGSVNFSSFAAGTQAADLRYTLPTSQPSTNQVLTATAVTGAGPYDITLGWSTPSGGATIGASVSGGTAGSVLFVGTGPVLAQDNANFYWDDTNNTFGVGTTRTGAISATNPSVRIKGTGATSSTSAFEVQDSAGATLFFVRDDGAVVAGANTSGGGVFEATKDQNSDTYIAVRNATSGTAASASLRLASSTGGYGHIKATSDVFAAPADWASSLVIEAHVLQDGGLWLSSYTNSITLATTATNAYDIRLADNGTVGFGVAPSAHLHAGRNLTLAAWGVAGSGFRFDSATYTDSSSSGTVASVAAHGIAQPTFAASSSTTYTDAANLYISNAPVAGTNVTLTNTYALWVDNGTVRLDGNVQVRTLTSGRVTYAGTNGLLQDSANMTFDGNRLALATTGNTGGLLIGGDANLYRNAADVLKTDDSLIVGANLSIENAGTLSLYESGSVNFSSFAAGTQANDIRYTLPTTQPSSSQILTASSVTGSGPYDVTLTWTTPATSGITIGDGITGSTVGSVLFVGAGSTLAQDNANFYWDDTNNTLGVGTTRTGAISGTNPSVRILGTGTSSATSSFEVQNSSAATILFVRNDSRVGIGTNTPSSDLAFGGDSARTLSVNRRGTGAGNNLTVQAGGAQSGGTDLAGGTLTLSSGIATGAGTSYVDVVSVINVGVVSGGSDNNPALHARFGSGKIGFGTSTLNYDLTLASMISESPYTYVIGMLNSTVTGGHSLNIQAGHVITTADLNGGNLILTAGNSTGSGSSSITFYTATAGGSGTTVRTSSLKMTLTGDGQLQISTTGSAAGILLGGDAQLYRSAADTLRTPDSLTVDVNLTVSGTASIGAAGGTTGTINLLGSTSGTVSVLVQAAAGTYNFNLPTTAGSSGHVLTSAGGGASAMTWTDPASLAVRWNSIVSPNGNQSLTMSTHTTTWNWATGTSTNNLFNLTTDASANGTGALLHVATGTSSTVVPLLVVAAGTTALTVNASAQVLVNSLTATRVTFAGTSGLLTDSSNFTYTTGTGQLALATTGSGAGVLIGGDVQIYRASSNTMSMAASDSFEIPSGQLGVGQTAPASGSRVGITYNATVGSGTERAVLYTGTVNAAHTGFYNLVQSEATTTHSTGTVNWISGALNRVRGQSTGGTVTVIYGLHNLAWMDSASGTPTYTSNIGVFAEAVWSNAAFTGTATVGSNIGLSISNQHAAISGGGTVSISNEYGVLVTASTATGVTVSNRFGVRIQDPGGAGTLTTQYGLYFEDLDRAGTNYGLYFAGTSGLSRQGIWWNGDVNLYRSAADTLKTDDSFVVGANLSVLNAGALSLYESGSVNFSSFAAGTQANDLRYTLPTTQPSTNQVLTATSISGSGPYDITLSWVTNSASITIGDAVNSGTAGSILFVGTGPVLSQDNANMFWDDTNNTLGIGTTRTGAISGTNPSVRILGTGASSATSSFEVQSSATDTLFFIRNDGYVGIGTNAPTSHLYVTHTLSADASLTLQNNILTVASAQTGRNIRTVFNQITLNTSGAISPSGSDIMPNVWNQLVVAGAHTGAITTPTYGLNNEVQIAQTGSTTHTLISGVRSHYNLNTGAGGTITTADSFISTLQSGTAVTSTITTFTHYNTSYSLSGSPVVGTLTGLDIKDPGAGTVTTQYGIRVRDQSRGSTNYALYFDGTSGLARQGIWWNADTNLYRSAANTLKTDDAFEALSFNKLTVTAPTTSATLTIADGATLTVNASATIQNGTHSGINTGDETASTIHNKTGYTQSFLLMGA